MTGRLKRAYQVVWSVKFWIVASWLTILNLENSVLNSGFFRIQTPDLLYVYWFGMTSGTAGLLAGIVLGVTYSKVKDYLLDHKVTIVQSIPKGVEAPGNDENPHAETKANQQ